MKDIKAGYQVHTTTWENDGDHYKTIVTSGLSKEDAIFIVALANKFNRRSKLANDYVKDTDLIEAVNDVFELNQGLSSEMLNIWKRPIEEMEDATYYVRELINEHILGIPDEYHDGGFCRLVENIDVYYIPSDIKNVTKEFI